MTWHHARDGSACGHGVSGEVQSYRSVFFVCKDGLYIIYDDAPDGLGKTEQRMRRE